MNPTNLLAAIAAVSVLGGTTPAIAEDATIVDHMHEHHAAMIKIQNAIIAGSLADTHEPASWLSNHEEPDDLAAPGDVFMAAVREAANSVLDAENIESAAEATSLMGLACGNCHLASDVVVQFDEIEKPSDQIKDKPHMQRHQWAADRMWEGLIGPSDAAWSRGADLLFESPVKPNVLAAHGGGDEVVVMSRRIHQLAGNASVVSDTAEKAEIFAEFIANCGACHTELGRGPKP